MSKTLNLGGPLEVVGADGTAYPARLMATDWKSSSQLLHPVAVAVDVGAREELHLFAPDGSGEDPRVTLRNAACAAAARDGYAGWGQPFDAEEKHGDAVVLKAFKERFDGYCEEIGIGEGGKIASHRIVGTIGVRCVDPDDDKDYRIVGLDVDTLPGCGCWSGITVEIEARG